MPPKKSPTPAIVAKNKRLKDRRQHQRNTETPEQEGVRKDERNQADRERRVTENQGKAAARKAKHSQDMKKWRLAKKRAKEEEAACHILTADDFEIASRPPKYLTPLNPGVSKQNRANRKKRRETRKKMSITTILNGPTKGVSR